MRPVEVAIVGRGAFGRFLKRALPRHFPQVRTRLVRGRASADALRRALSRSDAVVLAVPIRAYEEVVRRVVEAAPPSAVIVDVATVKGATQEVMERVCHGRSWLSIHPMFGPQSYAARGRALRGLTVVLTGHALPRPLLGALKRSARAAGLVVRSMTPQEHDRLLARTLFLTHYIGQTIAAAGFNRTPIDTVSFSALMQAVESVRNDVQLFADVYRSNPYCEEVIVAFEHAERIVHRFLREQLRR